MTRHDDLDPAVRKIPKSERNRWPLGDRTFLERQKWTIVLVALPFALLGLARLLVNGASSPIAFLVALAMVPFVAFLFGLAVAGVVDVVGRLLG